LIAGGIPAVTGRELEQMFDLKESSNRSQQDKKKPPTFLLEVLFDLTPIRLFDMF